MPLPKAPKLLPKERPKERRPLKSTSKSGSKTDARFSSFQTDAKFRLPSRKQGKTKLDSRFSRLLTDPEFYNKASVDRYGRKRDRDAGKKQLEKFYALDEEDDEQGPDSESARKRDRAVKQELAKVDIRGNDYDPIRDGGITSSSDDSSSEDEGDFDEEVREQAELAGQGNDVPMGDVTSRLAAVNMDWDNIRAADIMAVANSFVPAGGKIRSVVIYPSDFGRERLEREDIEGPPRDIFASTAAKNKNNLTSLDESTDLAQPDEEEQIKQHLWKESTGEEFDSSALRAYQLERLRYYYAVITCSSEDVAKSLYDNMDGLEYLSSANFFDLRFVPDDTTFDEDPREECEDLPDDYRPNEFKTDALTHSKVSLTWDADDTTRMEVQKRAFSRKEMDENELQAYIGSESEDEEQSAQPDKAAELRAALGLGSSGRSSRSKSSSMREQGPEKTDGDLEITFSTGLSTKETGGSVFEETTIEKYVRKERERRQRRKDRAKALKEGRDPDAEEPKASEVAEATEEEGDPWNDPFFETGPGGGEASKLELKKANKAKKWEEKEKEEQAQAAERAGLELLMVDDEGANVRHFDMNEIARAEKAKKKGKKSRKVAAAAAVEDNFKIDTSDARFSKLFESHEYAIDPTNPRFKGTSGMKALLEEGRTKRRHDRDDDETREGKLKKHKSHDDASGGADDLRKLAARVKAKSKKV